MHGYKWPLNCTRTRMPLERRVLSVARRQPAAAHAPDVDVCCHTGISPHRDLRIGCQTRRLGAPGGRAGPLPAGDEEV